VQVLLGTWQGVYVAVKMLRDDIVENASAADLGQFKEEAAMLKDLRHPNILIFYLARLDMLPYMLVSEVRKDPSAVAAAVQHAQSGVQMQACFTPSARAEQRRRAVARSADLAGLRAPALGPLPHAAVIQMSTRFSCADSTWPAAT